MPNKALAACSGSSSPFNCDQSTINLTLSSSSVKIGDSETFTVTINPNNTGLDQILGNGLQNQRTVQIITGSGVIQSKPLVANAGNTLTFDPVTIGGKFFTQANTYQVHVEVDLGCFQPDPTLPQICQILVGPNVPLVVSSASNTGPATLTLSLSQPPSINPGATSVTAGISYTYLPGATGQTPSQILYYCDYKGDQTTGFQSISAGSGIFTCSYSTVAASHVVFAKALDNSNPAQTLAAVNTPLTVQVTGNEANQGASNVSGVNDRMRAWVISANQKRNNIFNILFFPREDQMPTTVPGADLDQ